jgi:hypothetical protein
VLNSVSLSAQATAVTTYFGSLNSTLTNASSQATGSVTAAGQLNKTTESVSITATATAENHAQGNITLDAAVSVGSGSLPITGDSNTSLAPMTSDSHASVMNVGELAVTLLSMSSTSRAIATTPIAEVIPTTSIGTVTPNAPRVTSFNNDFYYRENKDSALVGPMSYSHALKGAQYLSLDKKHSGIAEVVTLLGPRNGDPAINPPKICVVHMYIRGKITLNGKAAQYHSDNGLPPTF